jgi:hypothetical protein
MILLQNYAGSKQIVKMLNNIGKGEAQPRKYKRLKRGSGQAYDCSNVLIATIAYAR